MQEVDAEIKMLCTLAAADPAFRPGEARLVVGIDNRQARLRKVKIVNKFVKINNFLNKRGTSNLFCFGR
jgi:hypothetical protein